jgi:hypothetical protein
MYGLKTAQEDSNHAEADNVANDTLIIQPQLSDSQASI